MHASTTLSWPAPQLFRRGRIRSRCFTHAYALRAPVSAGACAALRGQHSNNAYLNPRLNILSLVSTREKRTMINNRIIPDSRTRQLRATSNCCCYPFLTRPKVLAPPHRPSRNRQIQLAYVQTELGTRAAALLAPAFGKPPRPDVIVRGRKVRLSSTRETTNDQLDRNKRSSHLSGDS